MDHKLTSCRLPNCRVPYLLPDRQGESEVPGEPHIAEEQYMHIGEKTTICLLVTDSGFEIIGTSYCEKASSFNRAIGRNMAFEDAKRKFDSYVSYAKQVR